ncbi:MAG: type I glyceraldehyde-3-phosphate dehydrogenase [Candidatus Wildermuthbacteria bacterium]|nr:type I glyceraldehyde-3-phosphate dehydrogenase [Candidatus Wildermuthbacteria bacterium]
MRKIAINGFGRIGRLLFRQLLERSDFQIVAVNDLGDTENLAYLLQYDTVYGRFEAEVKVKNNHFAVAGHEVQVLQEKDPSKLPWRMLGVDIAIEATGAFESYEKARVHLEAGAKRVVITAPAADEDTEDAKTVLVGVNEDELSRITISSNGSCTTNAASPVVEVLRENPGIHKALLNTVHGYTATQNLVDGPTRGKDLRRGRAAAQNIVPSSTGAAVSVTRAIQELQEKFDGIALRVPVAAGSVADITFLAKRATSVQEVNDILSEASRSPRWKGILKVTKEPLVSSDIIKESYGAIVDLSFTRVVDGDLVKVLSWYDNEWGYAATLVKHLEAVARSL